MRVPRLTGLMLLALVAAAHGCGYRLQQGHGSRFTRPEVKVDLRPFDNRSTVPDAGAYLAARLREELRRTGYGGTFDRLGADYLIDGRVREVRDDVTTHDVAGYGLEHRITLVVDVRTVEVVRGRLLWKEEGIAESASYFAGQDYQYTEANRRAAFEEICRRMAVRMGQALRMIL